LGYPILSTLPVELLYIRGEALERGNKISWASESEENTVFHVIEYSNGIDDWK
jgi:hypothetical protein